jgi:3-hydroxyisobutyrate dehydrogenase
MAKPKLGYIGIGLMGEPMTHRLLAAGYEVTVWNRTASKCDGVVAKGAKLAASPADVANAADIVFACVMDAKAMEQVAFGTGGLAEAKNGAGKIVVDHSSIDPESTRSIVSRLRAANGMRWIDAPVSGGVKGAADGTLAIMAGGDPTDFAAVEPVVKHLAGRFTLMGPTGAGQVTKLINQLMVVSYVAATAEAVNLARNSGVDPLKLTEALAGGWADSKPFQTFVPRMAKGYDSVIGATSTFVKDMNAVRALAVATGTPLLVAGLAGELMRTLVAQGRGDGEPSDLASLYAPPKK